MKTCAFYTLGCKVNQYETQSIRESFIKAGYRELSFDRNVDVYIVNTCTVTAKADRESRHLIRETYRRNPSAQIIVTGCYVELDEDDIKTIPGVSLVVKNRHKDRIVELFNSEETSQSSLDKRCPPLTVSDFKGRTRAFLKIQDGCDNFCSYCKVPLVRGFSRSRDIESILTEAERLISKGFKEIVLVGICLGAWGEELSPKKTIVELLKRLGELEGDFRIRLSSIEPKYVSSEMAALIASSSKFCKHFHIPLQSGSNEILKMMNRPYTLDKYLDIVEGIRREIPDVSITTDILVGFPGEAEADFNSTCRLIEKVRPSRIHFFSYSRREGTAAANLKKEVPKGIVKGRMSRLKELTLETSYEYRKRFLGKVADVLIEDERDKSTALLKGYDDKYIKILLSGRNDLKSKIVPVRVEKVDRELTLGVISQNNTARQQQYYI